MSYLCLATRLSAAEGVAPAFVCTQASMSNKLRGKREMPGAGGAASRARCAGSLLGSKWSIRRAVVGFQPPRPASCYLRTLNPKPCLLLPAHQRLALGLGCDVAGAAGCASHAQTAAPIATPTARITNHGTPAAPPKHANHGENEIEVHMQT